MNSFWKVFPKVIKSELNEIDYWNRAGKITTIYKKINLCKIKFYLELRDSRYKSYIQSNFNKLYTKLLYNFKPNLYEQKC